MNAGWFDAMAQPPPVIRACVIRTVHDVLSPWRRTIVPSRSRWNRLEVEVGRASRLRVPLSSRRG